MYPGKTLHGKVVSIVWATGQGQLSPSGELPEITAAQPKGRFAVRIQVSEADMKNYRLPNGAGEAVAIYTNHGRSFAIVRRVVQRWHTWLNYLKFTM